MKMTQRLFFLLLLVVTVGNAQEQFSPSWLINTPARNIGPGGMSGRVTTIDVVLSDPDIIYAGTASGGVWKSTSGGINWSPIFDVLFRFPSLGIQVIIPCFCV